MDVKIGELEDLFERYRSGQDLRALSKLFDLAAPELLRLAVHMAPDVASAEDLVQQTFLAAIEKPRRWRTGEPLLPWLFGILANLAKKQRRAAGRRPEPDRLARRAGEDPEQRAFDAETQSAIRSALEGLPELYREVVRASLFEEKPPHEIARELERAPGTVRMQLLRGLELLRRALPAGFAGGALVLCGTRGEAALKAVVLQKAAAAPAVLAASTLTLGGLLVSTKAVVVTLVTVVGLCAWFLWPQGPREASALDPTEAAAARSSTVEVDTGAGAGTERGLASPAEASRSEVAPAAAAPKAQGGIFLVGKVLGAAPGHLSEITIEVGMPHGKGEGKPRADGSYEIDLSGGGPAPMVLQSPNGLEIKIQPPPAVPGESIQLDIWARHPRYISEHDGVATTDLFADLPAGERREVRCDIHMRPAAIVTGRVRVPAGWKTENADVKLEAESPDPADVLELTDEHSNCDEQGHYSIKSMRRGTLRVRAEVPGLLPALVNVSLEPGSVLELPDIVLEEGSCTIRGRVDLPDRLRNPDGHAIALAGFGGVDGGDGGFVQVWAQRVAPAKAVGAFGGRVLDAQGARREREIRGGCAVTQQRCGLASDGSFLLRGLEPGAWKLELHGLQASGVLPLAEETIVEAPAEGVVLGEQLGLIDLVVIDSSGSVGGALVTVGDGSTFTTFTTGADGRVKLAGDLRKDYTSSAGTPGRERVALELPAVGRPREARFELRLADAPRPGRLVFAPAEGTNGPKSVQLRLEPLEKEGGLQSRSENVVLANGRYELDGVLPGRWTIDVGPGEEQMPVAFYGGYMLSERFEANLGPGETFERELRCAQGGRLRITLEADASLKSNGFGCRLASLEGKAVPDPIFVSAVSGEGFGIFGASEHVMVMGERTQIALQDCLPAGRYELRLTSEKMHSKPLAFEIKLGETTQAVWKIE